VNTIILIKKKSSMGFKETAKKQMGDLKMIVDYRFQAAKIIFVLSAFIFFLHFFLLGARINIGILGDYVSMSYGIFVFSFALFTYYSLRKISLKKIPEWSKYIFMIIVL
jgi:hypothetical protein